MAKSLLTVIGRFKKHSYLKFQPELSEIITYQIQNIFAITLVTLRFGITYWGYGLTRLLMGITVWIKTKAGFQRDSGRIY